MLRTLPPWQPLPPEPPPEPPDPVMQSGTCCPQARNAAQSDMARHCRALLLMSAWLVQVVIVCVVQLFLHSMVACVIRVPASAPPRHEATLSQAWLHSARASPALEPLPPQP